MNTGISRAVLVALLALGSNSVALAAGDCGMNSNKPCPSTDKSSAKEPAYTNLNSNKPAARATTATPTEVKAEAREDTAAKATLSGVSASDLKLKPQTPKTSAKEPAGNN